jgi:hypothetical protein
MRPAGTVILEAFHAIVLMPAGNAKVLPAVDAVLAIMVAVPPELPVSSPSA